MSLADSLVVYAVLLFAVAWLWLLPLVGLAHLLGWLT